MLECTTLSQLLWGLIYKAVRGIHAENVHTDKSENGRSQKNSAISTIRLPPHHLHRQFPVSWVKVPPIKSALDIQQLLCGK